MSVLRLPFPFVADPELQANFEVIAIAVGELQTADFIGTGDPNGVITASPPATYRNRAGGAGATLWVKESGTATNTGWTAL